MCLNSGAAAVWINLLTKVVYYNKQSLFKSLSSVIVMGLVYCVSAIMIVVKGRVDILLSLVVAVADVTLL